MSSEEQVITEAELLQQMMTLNASYSSLLQRITNGQRKDVDKECDYPLPGSISPNDYRLMYDRFGIAARVVDLLPSECWSIAPSIYETEDEEEVTEFEQAVKDINLYLSEEDDFLLTPEAEKYKNAFLIDEDCSPIWDYLYRVDSISGIGRFGVLLLGIDTGEEMSLADPLPGFDDNDDKDKAQFTANEDRRNRIRFIRAFDESLVDIATYENNIQSARYGQPKTYNITLSDPTISHTGIGHDSGKEVTVHWSRVIHVAEDLISSQIFAMPRMQNVWPHLLNLRRLYGSATEMFWQGGFGGLAFETNPSLGNKVVIDKVEMAKQVQNYFNGLQRHLALTGVQAKPLNSTVSSPSSQIEGDIDAVCIKLGVPKRIFMGSERGELASSQDSDTWGTRLKGRRQRYVAPRIILRLFRRLIRLGILPIPQKGIHVKWGEKKEPTKSEQATTAKARVEAISAYISGGVDSMIAPMDFMTKEMGYDQDEAKEILENAMQHTEDTEEEEAQKAAEAQKLIQEGKLQPPGQQPPPGQQAPTNVPPEESPQAETPRPQVQ